MSSANEAGVRPRGKRPGPAAPATPLRVLVLSHGHPGFTKGGAEIAAYTLFRSLQVEPGVHAWFLGCQPEPPAHRLGAPITQPFGEYDFVYTPRQFEWFHFANRDPAFPAAFRTLLEALRPDIVHFHHFAFFGLEAFRQVKEVLPNAAVVLTLHEYLLICNHYGQMVTTQNEYLCHDAGLVACHDCFPEHSTADFFLRRYYADLFLPFVNVFIAPSRFLADRFTTWGLPPERVRIIDNLLADWDRWAAAMPPGPALLDPLRVGFFGQVSRLKGIATLLAAAHKLENEPIEFAIHGSYRGQPAGFQKEFLRDLEQAGPNVDYLGPYRPQELDQLMSQVAVVAVPSVWWENSPVVIQEAKRNRRPIIATGIGGMAEKVKPGLDGWHVPPKSVSHLVQLIRGLVQEPERVTRMALSMSAPESAEQSLREHTALYRSLLGTSHRMSARISTVITPGQRTPAANRDR